MLFSNKIIAGDYVVSLFDYMHDAHHITAEQLLINTNLKPLQLRNNKHALSKIEFATVIENILSYENTPQLVQGVIHNFAITQHGLLGLTILCGLNLRVALKALLKFYKLRTRLINFNFNEGPIHCRLTVSPINGLGTARQFTEEVTMAAIYKAKCQLLSHSCENDIIHFSHAETEEHAIYQDLYQCKVLFNQEQSQYLSDTSQLNQKLTQAHQDSFQLMSEQCEEQIYFNSNQHIDTVSKVKQIVSRCDEQFPTLPSVAKMLDVSSRTLSRRLQQSDTHFQSILDDERIYRAKELLLYTDLSVTEIGQKLHFSDASHFSKTFKRHTDYSPSLYRKAQYN
jgi:AraC-like DNA-binding protein